MLDPWAEGPFDLILHGELHYRAGNDFDRRIAMISFDNAIEVSISLFLSLHPIQRRGREYERKQVSTWLHDYHSKLDFLEYECQQMGNTWKVARAYITYYHDTRNSLYHNADPVTPQQHVLNGIREAALWVFSTLYAVAEVESILSQRIKMLEEPRQLIERDPDSDWAIDEYYGLVTVGDLQFTASEVLFNQDRTAYAELGQSLLEELTSPTRTA
ncbi:MAG: hypothetical protein M3354_01335 [Chloroflexota bacterium]|nr:hypothetical protein [Chloroflexota bacterium]